MRDFKKEGAREVRGQKSEGRRQRHLSPALSPSDAEREDGCGQKAEGRRQKTEDRTGNRISFEQEETEISLPLRSLRCLLFNASGL
jgi:hypothetical protein